MGYNDRFEVTEELKSVFEDFKGAMTEQKKELKNLGSESGETRQKLDRMHDRMDTLETKFNRPTLSGGNKLEVSEHAKAFDTYFRKGDDTEIKALSMNETVDPEGGYLVPPEYSDFILESLVQYSPVRRYARVIRVNSKDFSIPVQQQAQNLETGVPMSGLFRTGWTADQGLVPQTDIGQVGMKTIPSCDLYALPFASQNMLDDAAFNVEQYIKDNLAKSFAFAEGKAFIEGSGVGQPTGLLTSKASFSQVTANTGDQFSIGDSPDLIIDAFYALPDFYARNATWLMNRQTIRVVREWVDGNGQYLWTPNFGNTIPNAAPALILDRPYAECIDMQAPTGFGATGEPTYPALSTPILFGDIASAYVITDRLGVRVLRDPYSSKPFVMFYTTMRVGGLTVLPEAMVALNVNPN